MTPAYRVSLPARIDLRAIWSYIARDNLVAADRMLERFEAKFATVARQPMIGTACPELGADLVWSSLANTWPFTALRKQTRSWKSCE